jgi:outer membrane protein OmpA-like peptidoglycan-associated protein
MKARHLSTSALTLLALALGTAFALNVSRAQAQELAQKEVDRVETSSVEHRNADLQAQLLAANGQTTNRNLVASTTREASTALLLHDSELVLHFRSGSSTVETLYADDLKKFVALVQAMPDAIVQIYGFADRRGDQTDNLWLSQERVQSVEKALRDLGLRNFAYETTAQGEGKPLTATDSFENNFFDRRVVLRLRRESAAIASR